MILLDTCAIIWDALDPNRLSQKAKKAINGADKQNALIIADISIWEISMLLRKRLEIDSSPARFIFSDTIVGALDKGGLTPAG